MKLRRGTPIHNFTEACWCLPLLIAHAWEEYTGELYTTGTLDNQVHQNAAKKHSHKLNLGDK